MMAYSNLNGELIGDLKQKTQDHFWPHAQHTENMFGKVGIPIVR